MKKIVIFSLVCLIAIFGLAYNGQSKIKSYYSGDAVNFNSQLYIGSANTGSLEIFKLEGSNLKQLVRIKPFDARFNRYDDFYDLKLSVEDGHLFIYAVSGFTLYKYELTNDKNLTLIASQKNTYWEWYNRVDIFGDNVVTVSQKTVRIWNKDLQVINAYTFANSETPYNIRGYNNNFILNIQDNQLTVYDRETRTVLKNIPLNYKDNLGNRQAYQDKDNNLYVVDDYYAKKFNLDGVLLASFRHLDYTGYDIASSGASNYIYFSNGYGVVKLNKNTMQAIDWVTTGGSGGPAGWAMGLKTVQTDGEKLVVFNNSNILVLNSNLNKIASYLTSAEEDETSTENLYLNMDRTFGWAGTTVTLSGGGFFPNENLTINFGGVSMTGQTDSLGRFTQALTVPSLKPQPMDIKVDGQSSRLTYSIAFNLK